MALIQLRDPGKTYETGKLEFEALSGGDLDIVQGATARNTRADQLGRDPERHI